MSPASPSRESPWHVHAREGWVRDTTADWLRAGRLIPPSPVTVRVQMGTHPDGDARPAFRMGPLSIHAGPGPARRSHIVWRRGAGDAWVSPVAPETVLRLRGRTPASLHAALGSLGMAGVVLALRRTGWHHVHAASCVTPSGEGWLLAGNTHAGKTTTMALFAGLGWSIGGDDAAFLGAAPGGVVAHPWRAPLALRPRGAALVRRALGPGIVSRQGGTVDAETLGGRWSGAVPVHRLLFPVPGRGPTTVTPVTAGEAFAELLQWSAWVALEPRWADAHISLLETLARTVPAHRVRLGADLADDPSRLQSLLS